MLSAITWDVSPEIVEIFGRSVRWYGVFFALGLLILGPAIEERIWKRERLDPEWMNSLYIYVVIGTVIGARLGHVLFYDPAYYLAHPSKILAIWEGGLASHGGTIGVILALWIYSKRISKRSVLWILDRIAVPTGLVAALIRMGNLMNSEIFGHSTDLPWGFRFVRSQEYWSLVPDGVLGCHPTQIYEALAYLVIFSISLWLYFKKDAARRYEGLIIGVFFIGVFGARIIIESIKTVQEPWELEMVSSIGLNMGQVLSIPFVLIGLWLSVRALRNPLQPSQDKPASSHQKRTI